ncbi:MAG: hypothetical protein Q9169_006632 [Polycauliona sp. 2 TL-2023]
MSESERCFTYSNHRTPFDANNQIDKARCRNTSIAPHLGLPDPWIVHYPGDISTCEFYGLHGRLARQAALLAWRSAYEEAISHAWRGFGNQPLGTTVRHWAGRSEGREEIVDLVIHPEEEMTWRMLVEVARAARALICWDGRGFQFLVLVEGLQDHVGIGETKLRRRDEDGRSVAKRGEGKGEKEGTIRLPSPERIDRPEENATALRKVSDPFIFQHVGMLSSWVFHGYWGHLDFHAATMAARKAYNEAVNRHRPDDPIGPHPHTWAGVYRDTEPVEFTLYARPGMTWKMLAEGIRGAQMVVFGRKEFRFSVLMNVGAEAAGFGWMKRVGSFPPQQGQGANNASEASSDDPAAVTAETARVRAGASSANM